MKVKHFNFPDFATWFANKDGFEGKLGDYNCHIRVFSWSSNEKHFVFAVSTQSNPLNVYSETVFYRSFRWRWDDLETRDEKSLKDWYEATIIEFKDFWSMFILNTYLEDTLSVDSVSKREFDCEGEFCANTECDANHNHGCFAPIEQYADCFDKK